MPINFDATINLPAIGAICAVLASGIWYMAHNEDRLVTLEREHIPLLLLEHRVIRIEDKIDLLLSAKSGKVDENSILAVRP